MNRCEKIHKKINILVGFIFGLDLLLILGGRFIRFEHWETKILLIFAGLIMLVPVVLWLLYSLVRLVVVRRGAHRIRLLIVYGWILFGGFTAAVVFIQPVSAEHLRLKLALGQRNFSGIHLRPSANLRGADLAEANLRWAGLSGADLRRADLSGAKLIRADLSGADLSGADLSEADLREANLNSADLRGADLRGADLRQAVLWNVILDDSTQIDAKWRMVCAISNERRPGWELRGADLADAYLSAAILTDADLVGADLSRANLGQAQLSRADLSGADLSGAILQYADLSWANLEGANLADAKLNGAYLYGAKLPEGWTAP